MLLLSVFPLSIECLQIVSDLENMKVKWIVLETPVPEEKIVAAGRFTFLSDKTSYVDIICADESIEKSLRYLLLKIEHISFSHGQDKVVVGIPQWRSDLETVLLASEYSEQSGHIWPENTNIELIKPTMILEYHKTLNSNQRTGIVQAPVSFEFSNVSSSAYADGSLLNQLESVSIEESSFVEAKPGTYYNEDGVLCIDFDDDEQANESKSSGGGGGAVQGGNDRGAESMESLIDNLFSALHKSLNNNTL